MKQIETRADIQLLVDTFYNKVQQNKELNHIFNEVAKIDWEAHLPKMYDFWETLLFHKNVYKGNPMRVHKSLHQIQKLKNTDFEIWLNIFRQTVDELFEGEIAELAKNRAQSIATSIQLNTVYAKQ